MQGFITIGQFEQALRKISLSKSKIEMSCNDKNTLGLVNKDSVVYDGRFVTLAPLSKVTKVLLNNVFSGQKI